jgi:hypothetical protein
MNQTFRVQPAGTTALLAMVTIGVFFSGLGYLVWTLRASQPLVMNLAVVTTLALAGLFLWFAVAQSASVVAIEGQQLRISVPIYGRVIPLERVLADSVRDVSLPRDETYRLTRRTNGLGVPGYQLGWFRAQGEERVLAAVTGSEALAFRTKDDYAVLLSLADRAGFMRAVQTALATRT